MQEAANTLQRVPYRFTGKELDEETGLYYYGARYYDPRTSVWVSADPILGKYLPSGSKEQVARLPGIGGVYNPVNLSMYTYGHDNPIKYSDPDGRAVAIPFIYEGVMLLTAGTAVANDPAARGAAGKVIDQAIINVKIAGAVLSLPGQLMLNEIGEDKKSSGDKVDDLLDGSSPTGVKGNQGEVETEIDDVEDAKDKANDIFDDLGVDGIKEFETKEGKGREGSDSKGRNIKVRPTSSDGRPTIEVKKPGQKKAKEIRVGNSKLGNKKSSE